MTWNSLPYIGRKSRVLEGTGASTLRYSEATSEMTSVVILPDEVPWICKDVMDWYGLASIKC